MALHPSKKATLFLRITEKGVVGDVPGWSELVERFIIPNPLSDSDASTKNSEMEKLPYWGQVVKGEGTLRAADGNYLLLRNVVIYAEHGVWWI